MKSTNLLKMAMIFIIIFFPLLGFSQVTIPMEKDGGVYKIPCVINGLKLKLIFDTGASSVCISESIANMMLENNYLSSNDIIGRSQSQVADGRIVNHTKVNIKRLSIGEADLYNVEAIVIEGQSAPLLLGQSAISRLGRISISGNNLIINSIKKASSKRKYTEDELDAIYDEISEIKNNDELDCEKYGILYDNNYLSTVGKIMYMGCLRRIGKIDATLEIGQKIVDNLYHLTLPNYSTLCLYYSMAYCHMELQEFEEAIKYGLKGFYYCDYTDSYFLGLVGIIARSNNKLKKTYKVKSFVGNKISEYLNFINVDILDCWNKGFKDELIGELYYNLYLYAYETDSDIEKYSIISAAWGNKESIEFCNKYGFDYSRKPFKYEY